MGDQSGRKAFPCIVALVDSFSEAFPCSAAFILERSHAARCSFWSAKRYEHTGFGTRHSFKGSLGRALGESFWSVFGGPILGDRSRRRAFPCSMALVCRFSEALSCSVALVLFEENVLPCGVALILLYLSGSGLSACCRWSGLILSVADRTGGGILGNDSV